MSDTLCTLHVSLDKISCLPVYELQQKLEDSSVKSKIIAMENVILGTLKGDDLSSLLIPIIRYVLSNSDHKLIKLVHLYFEIVEKTNLDGSIREEIILVCNALRNYLHAPNEYVRGSTLRLLCKIKHWKILSPLIPSIIQNLTHKEPYVRRYAVMCVATITRQFGHDAIPDLIGHIKNILLNESDTSTKCKAFHLLLQFNPSMALQYVLSIEDSLISSGDIFQTGIVQSLNKFVAVDQACKTIGIRVVLLLLETVQAINVIYQGATALLTSGATSIEARKVTAKTLVNILIGQPDVNIKLITLSNLRKMYNVSNKAGDYPNVLESHVIDITRMLSNPYHLIVKESLSLCLQILTEANVGQVLSILKKEFIKSCTEYDKSVEEYQVTVIKAIMQICELFPHEADIVFEMFDCLTIGAGDTKYHIAILIRKLFNLIPDFKRGTINKLLQIGPNIDDIKVMRICFSILSHVPSFGLSTQLIDLFYDSLQPYPLVNSSTQLKFAKYSHRSVDDGEQIGVLKDKCEIISDCNLRKAVLTSDSLLLSYMSSLLLHCVCNEAMTQESLEKACIVVSNLLILGRSSGIERGSLARITYALRILLDKCKGNPTADAGELTLDFENLSIEANVCDGHADDSQLKIQSAIKNHVGVPVTFRLLNDDIDMALYDDLVAPSTCVNNNAIPVHLNETSSLYDNVPFQMTGLSDPIYIEVLTNVVNYELHLTITISNNTNVLLQNIYIELYTQGKLKVMDHLPTFKLSPKESTSMRTRVRVNSSAMGSIFGYVYYEQKACGRPEVLNLLPININMIDFVTPTFISSEDFQALWSSYEWENKIPIQSNVSDSALLLEKLINCTKMTVAGRIPPAELISSNGQNVIQRYIEYLRGLKDLRNILETCSFFAANLFLRTIFNEDALINLSVSKDKRGFLNGAIRIRCASHESVVSLGEKVSFVQRCFSSSPLDDH